ncbi:hypothetical protein GCM10009715_26940 [Paeniglutamicibacter psychrophenolicus]
MVQGGGHDGLESLDSFVQENPGGGHVLGGGTDQVQLVHGGVLSYVSKSAGKIVAKASPLLNPARADPGPDRVSACAGRYAGVGFTEVRRAGWH